MTYTEPYELFYNLIGSFKDRFCTYLNTATCAPLLDQVQFSMMRTILEDAYPGSRPWVDSMNSVESLRETLAQLLLVPKNDLVIVENATKGLLLILNGMIWGKGDEIVIVSDSHASAFIPVFAIKERFGVLVTIIDTDKILSTCRSGLMDFMDKVSSSKVRLIMLSHVTWNTGRILPLSELISWAHDRKIISVIDGAQGMGHVPISLATTGCDAYVFSGHKWLLGPSGTGAVWMTPELRDSLWPSQAGYSGVIGFTMAGNLFWRDGSSRFETSTRNIPVIEGWITALNLISKIGLETIGERIVNIANEFRIKLNDILRKREDIGLIAGDAGIITITGNLQLLVDLYECLSKNHIIARLIDRPKTIRFSIHAFNSVNDIDRTLDVIEKFFKERNIYSGGEVVNQPARWME